MSDLSALTVHAKTRFGKLLLIEQAITQVSPDFLETCDLLDAITGALETKYPGEDITEILHEFRQAKQMLEETDATQHREPDGMDLAKWEAELANQQRVNDE